MTDKTLRGRFVWHELVTPAPAEGHQYYNALFHWKTARSEHHPDYTMFATGGERIGGTVELKDGAPRWVHYIGTPDLDATIEQATGLGATVIEGPVVISDDSRYAVLNDPQGAAFALYSTSQPYGEDRTPRRGEFSWMEIAATDANEALHFYCALFGWERTAAHDMGPMGFYYLFGRNGRDIGGAFDKPADIPGPPGWLGYIRAKDLDDVVAKARAGGGTLINGPMEVPGGDWIAQFVDPQGAMFAVHVVKEDVDAAKAARAREPEAAPAAPEPAARLRKTAMNKSTSARKKSTPAAKKSTAAARKAASKKRRAKVKSAKRSARKAGTVRTRPSKTKAKVGKVRAASRKKSGTRKKPARPKKGK